MRLIVIEPFPERESPSHPSVGLQCATHPFFSALSFPLFSPSSQTQAQRTTRPRRRRSTTYRIPSAVLRCVSHLLMMMMMAPFWLGNPRKGQSAVSRPFPSPRARPQTHTVLEGQEHCFRHPPAPGPVQRDSASDPDRSGLGS